MLHFLQIAVCPKISLEMNPNSIALSIISLHQISRSQLSELLRDPLAC